MAAAARTRLVRAVHAGRAGVAVAGFGHGARFADHEAALGSALQRMGRAAVSAGAQSACRRERSCAAPGAAPLAARRGSRSAARWDGSSHSGATERPPAFCSQQRAPGSNTAPRCRPAPCSSRGCASAAHTPAAAAREDQKGAARGPTGAADEASRKPRDRPTDAPLPGAAPRSEPDPPGQTARAAPGGRGSRRWGATRRDAACPRLSRR